MRDKVPFLGVLVLTIFLAAGCANTERKFGRGMSNVFEIARLGEFRRSVEQTALFDGPDAGYSHGFISGINKTLARTGVGLYEMVTAPLPPYDPIFTSYLAPDAVYPDSYAPTLMEDSMFATDANLGFGGGDVLPMVPGSRFRVFDAH